MNTSTHLNGSYTCMDKHTAEYKQPSQNEHPGLIPPSTYFVYSEKDESFGWNLYDPIDELCEINVHTKSADIQADSVISEGHSKPASKTRLLSF